MPPVSIRPRWNQANDRGTLLGRVVCLPHPLANGPAVRRIHEHGVLAPILLESILVTREVFRAFGIRLRGAGIECETKLLVQRFKQPLRRGPLGRARHEMDIF